MRARPPLKARKVLSMVRAWSWMSFKVSSARTRLWFDGFHCSHGWAELPLSSPKANMRARMKPWESIYAWGCKGERHRDAHTGAHRSAQKAFFLPFLLRSRALSLMKQRDGAWPWPQRCADLRARNGESHPATLPLSCRLHPQLELGSSQSQGAARRVPSLHPTGSNPRHPSSVHVEQSWVKPSLHPARDSAGASRVHAHSRCAEHLPVTRASAQRFSWSTQSLLQESAISHCQQQGHIQPWLLLLWNTAPARPLYLKMAKLLLHETAPFLLM